MPQTYLYPHPQNHIHIENTGLKKFKNYLISIALTFLAIILSHSLYIKHPYKPLVEKPVGIKHSHIVVFPDIEMP